MLYKVTRTDATDYDQYSAVIIKARSIEQAFTLATSAAYGSSPDWYIPRFTGFKPDGSNLLIRRINPKLVTGDDPSVVLASFNAG